MPPQVAELAPAVSAAKLEVARLVKVPSGGKEAGEPGKGQWLPEEDARLFELVTEHGAKVRCCSSEPL